MDRHEKESLDHWLTTPPEDRDDSFTIPDAGFGGQDITFDLANPQAALDEASATPLYIGGETIDDVIAKHLIECNQCADSARKGPVKLGEKSRHCDDYWHLQWLRATYEGQVNNIVAHTEYGDEAPVRGRLD